MPEDHIAPTLPTLPTLPPRDGYRPQSAYQSPPINPIRQPVVTSASSYRPSRRWPWSLALLLAAGGAAFLVFGTGDDSATAEPTTAAADNAVGAPVDLPGVGATQLTSGFEVTLLQAVDPWMPTNDFEAASDGRRYVGVELAVKNTTDETEVVLGQMMASLVDDAGRPANFAFAGSDLTSIDGSIEPGAQLQGWVVFELPADATGLRLDVKGSVLSPAVLFGL